MMGLHYLTLPWSLGLILVATSKNDLLSSNLEILMVDPYLRFRLHYHKSIIHPSYCFLVEMDGYQPSDYFYL